MYKLKSITCLIFFIALTCTQEIIRAESTPFPQIDLNMAIYRALTSSLNLSISQKEALSSKYQVEQASLSPNPLMSYEIEDFAGNNEWRGWDHREERYIWSQLFETARKRFLRTQAALYQYYATVVGYDVSKLYLLNRLTRAFIQVVAAQELLKITHNQAEIAKEVLRIATKKVEAGKVSLIQQNKAQVAYSTALVAVEKAKTDFKNSKKRLTLLWSQTIVDFEEAIFPFYETESPKPLEECLNDLCNQPEIVQSLYNYLNVEKNLQLQKANQIPNVTLQVGYKANYNGHNQGLIAGVQVPIPLFDRNQGNIKSAYYNMLKTGDQGRQLWLLLETKLSLFYEELLQAYENANRLKQISLPASEEAFELAQKGYREGKYEYLDVLDAQRTLFEVRAEYIQTLVLYHSRKADIHYLNSQTD